MAAINFDELEPGFLAALLETDSGAMIDRLDDDLRDCVMACKAHGGASTLTLKLTVKLTEGHDAIYTVTPTVTKKVPQRQPHAALMYGTRTGELVSSPEEQEKLDFSSRTPVQHLPRARPVATPNNPPTNTPE